MPDLLLELRSEEIPARMQRKAAGDLRKMVTDGLVEAGLTYEGCQEYWTPRRLALDIRGVTARSRDVREERKGPSVKAPEQAIQGFLGSAGLADISQAEIQSDPKKGDFYVARLVRPGRAAEEIIAELMPAVIRSFPWPKSMRWGKASARPGSLRWVRPLQSIVCTFGPETAEPVVVDFEVDGIRAGNVTYGHRFHAPDAITVRRFEDYAAKLEAAKVVLDAERRKYIILQDAKTLAFANGLELVEDEALLEEVSGLVEWPVVLLGEFERDYLEIPAEVIRLTIRANQKCFVMRSSGTADVPSSGRSAATFFPGGEGDADAAASASSPRRGEGGERSEPGEGAALLSNHFLLTANIEARDGGAEIVHGNGKVVRARLSDALYFWKTDQADLPDLGRLQASAEKFGLDLRKPLDQRMARLDHLGVTFHAKLGTQGERVERIARLAEEIAAVLERSTPPGPSGHPPRRGEGGAPGSAAAQLAGEFATEAPSSPSTGEVSGRSPDGGGASLSEFARRAAVLAKADLQTEVVGEFPELQGAIGRKYALLQGEHPSVAAAVEEHYKPQGPSDRVPTDPVSIAVALADKLDTLVGFWAIDEKPTGSKDPYALRRAALGVIRILVENGVRLGLAAIPRSAITSLVMSGLRPDGDYINLGYSDLVGERIAPDGSARGGSWHEEPYRLLLGYDGIIDRCDKQIALSELGLAEDEDAEIGYPALEVIKARANDLELMYGAFSFAKADGATQPLPWLVSRNYDLTIIFEAARRLSADLLSFFHDRLKVYLRDQGARHDLIDAVLAAGSHQLSRLEGEMSAKPTEGVAPEGTAKEASRAAAATPPGQPSAGHPPLKGEGAPALNDDLLMIVRRVEALGELLNTEDGKNLLAGTKRAVNILAIEAKKGTRIAAAVDPALLADPAEKTLHQAVNQAEKKTTQAIQDEDFFAAMRALAALREPVDSFFEKVLVNVEDEAVRANRLALLARIRAATDQVADFSKIAG